MFGRLLKVLGAAAVSDTAVVENNQVAVGDHSDGDSEYVVLPPLTPVVADTRRFSVESNDSSFVHVEAERDSYEERIVQNTADDLFDSEVARQLYGVYMERPDASVYIGDNGEGKARVIRDQRWIDTSIDLGSERVDDLVLTS